MHLNQINVMFLLDPLTNFYGPLMPPFLIAKELRSHFRVIFTSPIVSNEIAEVLNSFGFDVLNLGKSFCSSGSLLTFEAWLRQFKLRSKRTDYIVVNFSQCFLTAAHIYYAQGPIAKALDDISTEIRQIYRLIYMVIKRFLIRKDKVFNNNLRDRSRLFVANSLFCANLYKNLGIKVDKVIYPPLDCERFKPTAHEPSEDYVLTYAGKETKYSVLRDIIDANIKLKVFGSKAPYVPSFIFKQPNIEFLGKVEDQELLDLYSNALYTLFVFSHEPFGYIPIESMACGTPVLTYGRQGPSESVVNQQTGWFVENDQELVNVATRLWKEGYPQNMRDNCRKRALHFDVKIIAKKWLKLIKELVSSS